VTQPSIHESERAHRTAERYHCEFVNLSEQSIDLALFQSIPAELMFRLNFVPLSARGNDLVIATANPGDILSTDELPLLLNKRLIVRVATQRQIGDLLKRMESSQGILSEMSKGFR